MRANIPSGKLNWVDPAAGVQHWFNKHDLTKRAEAVANAATAMADTPHRGTPRVISDCHFAVQLDHFIPGFLSYSVAVFLK